MIIPAFGFLPLFLCSQKPAHYVVVLTGAGSVRTGLSWGSASPVRLALALSVPLRRNPVLFRRSVWGVVLALASQARTCVCGGARYRKLSSHADSVYAVHQSLLSAPGKSAGSVVEVFPHSGALRKPAEWWWPRFRHHGFSAMNQFNFCLSLVIRFWFLVEQRQRIGNGKRKGGFP
jgi:hypothetical protein